MAPSLESCPCPKCSGALVSHKTVLRHAVANLNQPIQTFNEWIAAAPQRLDRETDGSREDDHDDGMDEDEDEDEHWRVIREQRLDRADEPFDVCRVTRVHKPMNKSGFIL